MRHFLYTQLLRSIIERSFFLSFYFSFIVKLCKSKEFISKHFFLLLFCLHDDAMYICFFFKEKKKPFSFLNHQFSSRVEIRKTKQKPFTYFTWGKRKKERKKFFYERKTNIWLVKCMHSMREVDMMNIKSLLMQK